MIRVKQAQEAWNMYRPSSTLSSPHPRQKGTARPPCSDNHLSHSRFINALAKQPPPPGLPVSDQNTPLHSVPPF